VSAYALLALREVEEDSSLVLRYSWMEYASVPALDDPPMREWVEGLVEDNLLRGYDGVPDAPAEALVVGPLWIAERDARRLYERYSYQFSAFAEWQPNLTVCVCGAFTERGDDGQG
jgi:hypothetical protein